jgi:hypothetical protein
LLGQQLARISIVVDDEELDLLPRHLSIHLQIQAGWRRANRAAMSVRTRLWRRSV